MQNTILLNRDNPIIFEFTFTGDFEVSGLNNFITDITVQLGDEVYSINDSTPKLFIDSPTELRLSIGDTTALSAGYYTPIIIGYSPTYNDGYVLNSEEVKQLARVKVI